MGLVSVGLVPMGGLAMSAAQKATWRIRRTGFWLLKLYVEGWVLVISSILGVVLLPWRALRAFRREKECQQQVVNLAKNLDETSRALKEVETRLEITQRRERRARERLQELHEDKRKLRDRVKAAILQMEILERDKRRAEELAAMAKEALSNAEEEMVTPASIAMSKNYERVGFVEPPRGGDRFAEPQGAMDVEGDSQDQVESGKTCRRCEGEENMRGAKEVVLLGWVTTGLLSLLMIDFVIHDGISLSLVATFASVYFVVAGFAFGSAETVGGLAVTVVCLNSFALGLLMCQHSLGNALLGGVVRTFKGLDYMMQAIFSEPAVPQPAIGLTTQ